MSRGTARRPERYLSWRTAGLAGLLVTLLTFLAGASAHAQDDVGRHPSCEICGMSRKGYGYGRMLVRYSDGSETGVCSLHCALGDIDANPGKTVKSFHVADRDTRELIDAGTAFWVMGGRKRGVMTAVPKWAFGSRTAADTFVSDNGGRVVPWIEALSAAREERKK